MEQLKALLTYKFWIECGIALLLPVVGWWIATGSLSAHIEKRTGELDQKFSGIPQPGQVPNEKWIEQVGGINETEARALNRARQRLWERQKEQMTWPPQIQSMMAGVPYRGEPRSNTANELYRSSYQSQIDELWSMLDPVRPSAEQGKIQGKILVNKEQLTFVPDVPDDLWENLPPDTEEMWDAQEDIWLLSSLLQSIDRLNQGADNVGDAPVRRIDEILLVGGSGKPEGGEAAGATGGSTGGMEAPMEGEGAYPGMGGSGGQSSYLVTGSSSSQGRGGMGGYGGGESGAGGGRTQVDFNVEEEFGSAAVQQTGGGEGGMAASSSAMSGGEPPMSGYGGQGQGQETQRYVDDADDLPFKTRGFKLRLVIDHRRLPDLLVELINSDWPTEIVRVHQAEFQGGQSGSDSGSSFRSSGRTPMGSEDYMSGSGGPPGNYETAQGSQRSGNTVKLAFSDPYLATVVLAGKIYIFKPPEEKAGEAAGQSASGAAETTASAGSGTEATNAGASATDSTGTDAAETTPGADGAQGEPAETSDDSEDGGADAETAAPGDQSGTEKTDASETTSDADAESSETSETEATGQPEETAPTEAEAGSSSRPSSEPSAGDSS